MDGLVLNGCWKKGSRSNGTGGSNCVEVERTPEGIFVRDSKNPTGPKLMFTEPEWTAFVDSAKDGEFDV